MNDDPSTSPRLFRVFTALVASLVAGGWFLSLLDRLSWMALLAPLALVCVVWWGRGPGGTILELWREVKAPLSYRPFQVLALFILAAGTLYQPVMLDSLTYRIPRILLWLREGHVAFFGMAEARLDYLGHAWELCNVPVVLLLGVRWVWLWNFAAWVVSYLVFSDWARQYTQKPMVAYRLAVFASTSVFGVLQASNTGNDILAVALLLLALNFIVNFERERHARWINWAALSLCLAAAVKAHFSVLFLAFGIWFWAARSQPRRVYPWRWLPVWLALLAFCSPLPTFIQNHLHYGQITGPAGDTSSFAGAGRVSNILLGTGLMSWQVFQPGVNPLALTLNEPLTEWVASTGAHKLAPRFEMRMVPVSMVDNASFGIVTGVLLVIGLFLVLRHGRIWLRSWPGWAALAGVTGFLIAVSQFLPSTLGQSFAGFIFLTVPLAMAGWARFSERTQRAWVVVCMIAGLGVLVLTPSRPLWPAAALQGWLERSGRTGAARAMETYLKVTERGEAGRSLVAAIPSDESRFVALIGGEDPLLPTLTTGRSLEKAILLPLNAPVDSLIKTGARYVLVSGMAVHSFPEICAFLEADQGFQLVQSAEYTCKLARGPQTWKLYKRVDSRPLTVVPSG